MAIKLTKGSSSTTITTIPYSTYTGLANRPANYYMQSNQVLPADPSGDQKYTLIGPKSSAGYYIRRLQTNALALQVKNSSGKTFITCNDIIPRPSSPTYNSVSAGSVTLGTVTYGSWSSWSVNYKSGNTTYYKRSRRFDVTATYTANAYTNRVYNEDSYLSQVCCNSTGNSTHPAIAFTGSVGGSFNCYKLSSSSDISSLSFSFYDAQGAGSSKSVSCSLDCYDTKSETSSSGGSSSGSE